VEVRPDLFGKPFLFFLFVCVYILFTAVEPALLWSDLNPKN
jgi:hypothetical protein